jgi:hypothetical protein
MHQLTALQRRYHSILGLHSKFEVAKPHGSYVLCAYQKKADLVRGRLSLKGGISFDNTDCMRLGGKHTIHISAGSRYSINAAMQHS